MPTDASTPGSPALGSPPAYSGYSALVPAAVPRSAPTGYSALRLRAGCLVTVPLSASRGYSAAFLGGYSARFGGYSAGFGGYSARPGGYSARLGFLGRYSALDASIAPVCRATAFVLLEPGWQMDAGKTPTRSPGAGRPSRRGVTVPLYADRPWADPRTALRAEGLYVPQASHLRPPTSLGQPVGRGASPAVWWTGTTRGATPAVRRGRFTRGPGRRSARIPSVPH
jgi:hypothetical protein